MAATPLGRRIRQLRGQRTLEEIDVKAKIGKSKLSKLERGEQTNPTLETLESVARGLEVPLALLFTTSPRPEKAVEHGEPAVERVAFLDELLRSISLATPSSGSLEAAAIQAIATLAAALGRSDVGSTPESHGEPAAPRSAAVANR